MTLFIGSVLDTQNNLAFKLENDVKVKVIHTLGKKKTVFYKEKLNDDIFNAKKSRT